jgi:hypothetical protein
MDTVPVEYLMFFLIAPPSGSAIYDLDERGKVKEKKDVILPRNQCPSGRLRQPGT